MLEMNSIAGGRYRIKQIIGSGGTSIVYLAEDMRTGRKRAVKEIKDNGIALASQRIELNFLKQLEHKGLPEIVDIIEQNSIFLIVMEYVEGESLKDLISRGPILQQDVISYGIMLCEVLTYLHSRKPKIIYRDMKPGNVIVRKDKSIVLVDLGSAREHKTGEKSDTVCLGTRGYAAPEQFGGMGQTDERTDIYNLGMTLHHLVTGHDPVNPPYETYPIRHWNDMLSSGLEKIICKCTSQNPEDRYQDCKQLKYALENYFEEDSKYLKKQMWILRGFVFMSLLFIAIITSTIYTSIRIDNIRKSNCKYYLSLARQSENMERNTDLYKKALENSMSDTYVYEQLIDIYLTDITGFDESVMNLVTGLMNERISYEGKTYMDKLQNININIYILFNYKLGIDFWLCDNPNYVLARDYLKNVASTDMNSLSEESKRIVTKAKKLDGVIDRIAGINQLESGGSQSVSDEFGQEDYSYSKMLKDMFECFEDYAQKEDLYSKNTAIAIGENILNVITKYAKLLTGQGGVDKNELIDIVMELYSDQYKEIISKKHTDITKDSVLLLIE